MTVPLVHVLTTPTAEPGRPDAYAVVYRTVENGADSWEVLEVHRPASGSDLTYPASPDPPGPGAAASGGSVATPISLYAVASGRLQTVGGRQPGPPPADQDLLTQLPDMAGRGLARDLHQSKTLAGTTCELWRFAEPPAGPVAALKEGADHDDLCIDGDGIVLSEAWTYQGHLAISRTAVERRVAADGRLDTSGLPVPPPVSSAAPAKGQADTAVIEPHPNIFLATPPTPKGFEPLMGPVSLVVPDPQGSGGLIAASITWSFVKGPDVITVEAGEERPGQLPWQPGDTVTEPVTLTGLGPATTALRSDGAEVRVDLGGGRFLRVHGPLTATALVDYAQGLRLTPGAGATPAG